MVLLSHAFKVENDEERRPTGGQMATLVSSSSPLNSHAAQQSLKSSPTPGAPASFSLVLSPNLYGQDGSPRLPRPLRAPTVYLDGFSFKTNSHTLGLGMRVLDKDVDRDLTK